MLPPADVPPVPPAAFPPALTVCPPELLVEELLEVGLPEVEVAAGVVVSSSQPIP
jgi:hypothetical protein